MREFTMNNDLWCVVFVDEGDERLIDRTGDYKFATTDPATGCIYISKTVGGDLLWRVLIHELGHCAMFSFGLIDAVHAICKRECWVYAEEWICNFIADYGMMIFSIAYTVLREQAIEVVPNEIERIFNWDNWGGGNNSETLRDNPSRN